MDVLDNSRADTTDWWFASAKDRARLPAVYSPFSAGTSVGCCVSAPTAAVVTTVA
jgi:hypothetical protein